MRITDIRLSHSTPDQARRSGLLAMASFTLEGAGGFRVVVAGAKVVQPRQGGEAFVSLPSQHRQSHCRECRRRSCCCANYCQWCGLERAPDEVAAHDSDCYVDAVHAADAHSRRQLQTAVMQAYRASAAAQPAGGPTTTAGV